MRLYVARPGVVVHVPSMLKELQALKDAGVDYRGRVILSDRAHMVFDFHQTVSSHGRQGSRPQQLGMIRCLCWSGGRAE